MRPIHSMGKGGGGGGGGGLGSKQSRLHVRAKRVLFLPSQYDQVHIVTYDHILICAMNFHKNCGQKF